jgi:hypothetical protein
VLSTLSTRCHAHSLLSRETVGNVQANTYEDDNPDLPAGETALTPRNDDPRGSGGGGGGGNPGDPDRPISNSKTDKPEVGHGTDVRLLIAGNGTGFLRMKTYQKVSSTD